MSSVRTHFFILLLFGAHHALTGHPQGVHVPTTARTGKKTAFKRAPSNDVIQVEKQKPTTFLGKLKAGITDLFVAGEYVSEVTLAELKKIKMMLLQPKIVKRHCIT